jgi:hypothetical protein
MKAKSGLDAGPGFRFARSLADTGARPALNPGYSMHPAPALLTQIKGGLRA